MKKSLKDTAIGKKLGAKGLYISIAACILAAGGAGVAAYRKTVSDLNENLDINVPPVSSVTSAAEKAVDNNQSNVKKENTADDTSAAETKEAEDEAMRNVKTQPNIMPVNGEILNPFSNGELVKSETLGVWKTHDGVDIKADPATPVKAMNKGKVTKVWEDPLMGFSVTVDHGNGIIGYYQSLTKEVNVTEGDYVNAGDIIGAVGDTAQSESAGLTHLHFGLKKSGKWIDPLEYIKGSSSK